MRKIKNNLLDTIRALFYSDHSARKVSRTTGMSVDTVINQWIIIYGKEAVRERGRRMRISSGRKQKASGKLVNRRSDISECVRLELIELFSSTETIESLEKQFGIDQRNIRKIWRDTFGSDDVAKRGVRIRTDASVKKISLPKSITFEAKSMAIKGVAAPKIAEALGISHSSVMNMAEKNADMMEALKKSASKLRSKTMTRIRRLQSPSVETRESIVAQFETDLFPHEIAEPLNVSPGYVRNVFVQEFGKILYDKRITRLEPERVKRCLEGLDRAGRLGSKAENLLFKILSERLECEIIHHDYSLCPPYEIDISIPSAKIAIMWDGIGHFKPIFGQKMLDKVQMRDIYKRRHLKRLGWDSVSIEDKCPHFDRSFVEHQAAMVINMVGERQNGGGRGNEG